MNAVESVQSANPVLSAIKAASAKTGVDFDYLLSTAKRESSLNPLAKSNSSSAAGLFQFVERTWIDMVDRYGEKLGLKDLADGIEQGADGRQSVPDGEKRSAILALRHDPEVASYMAAQYTKESASTLESKLGRQAKTEELYLAHFFGAGTAARFVNALNNAPESPAATLFPGAASANKSVYYNSDGTSKSLRDVFNHLVKRHQDKAPSIDPGSRSVVAEILRGPAGRSAQNQTFSLGLPGAVAEQQWTLDRPVPGRLAPALVLSPQIIELLAEVERFPSNQRSANNA